MLVSKNLRRALRFDIEAFATSCRYHSNSQLSIWLNNKGRLESVSSSTLVWLNISKLRHRSAK